MRKTINLSLFIVLVASFLFSSSLLHAQKYSISHIKLMPKSGTALDHNQRVLIKFRYTSPRSNIYIFARPMTGGSVTPNYAASPSKKYMKKVGVGDQWFTITKGNALINRIRFQIYDSSRTKILFKKYVSVRYKYPKSSPAALRVPKQLYPRSGSKFTNYPRKLMLKWQPIGPKGSVRYDVQIDCLHCKQSGKWDSQVGAPWKSANGLVNPAFAFTFVGDNQGRWRVRATRGSKKSNWSPWWGFSFKTGSSSGSSTGTKKLPDLVITAIQLNKNCNVAVTIRNIGKLGVPASSYDLPKAVALQMYKDGKPWGGLILKGVDPAGKLKMPGGYVTHVVFPASKKLIPGSGPHKIKAVIDSNKFLPEANENNNSKTVMLKCKKMGVIGTPELGTVVMAKTPKRFLLNFVDAYLVYSTSSNSIQIATEQMVLSYGQDWQKKKVKPYLYHLRQNFWKGFYWQVNTSKKEVYLCKGKYFGTIGDKNKTKIPHISVQPVGGSATVAPTRFFLRFKQSRLVYVPSSKTLQISAGNKVLSYGGDWQKCQLKSHLFHLKQKVWKNFIWLVDTNKRAAYKVTGAQFCKMGGAKKKLRMGVNVVK